MSEKMPNPITIPDHGASEKELSAAWEKLHAAVYKDKGLERGSPAEIKLRASLKNIMDRTIALWNQQDEHGRSRTMRRMGIEETFKNFKEAALVGTGIFSLMGALLPQLADNNADMVDSILGAGVITIPGLTLIVLAKLVTIARLEHLSRTTKEK